MAVWGASGDQMQLVSNAGGPHALIRRLPGRGSGPRMSCVPIGWWQADTVLASCAVSAPQSAARQLWLVPDNGSTAQPLTAAPSGTAAGTGVDTGGWQAGGQQYTTQTTSQQCSSAAPGSAGLAILRLASNAPVAVPGSTGNYNAVLASARDRLLVLAQTGCPGSSTLLWLNPATGATQTVLSAPTSQAGVIAAVAYGAGTPAAGN